MKAERLEIFGRSFPKGFATIHGARREVRESISITLPAKYFTRDPKEGEHMVELRVDPNGVSHDRGDVLLNLGIQSDLFPNLRGDWEIVQIKPTWRRGHDGATTGWYRFAILKPAKPADAAKAREIYNAHSRKVMDGMMNS